MDRVRHRTNKRIQKLLTVYRPVTHVREGLMFGMRQPMDGPVFEKLEHAEEWCIDVMIDHYDRRLGLSDAAHRTVQVKKAAL